MLRAVLPHDFPSNARAEEVECLLQDGIHVLAPAVSGAGKTKLAFDVARRAFSLYFDFNGGHGKVPQDDVKLFWRRCGKLANEAKYLELSLEEAKPHFQHLIGALFLARWSTMISAMHNITDLTPADWLWMQTDSRNLTRDCFNKCLALSPTSLEQLLNVLSDMPGDNPVVLLDESQRLLVHDEWFQSLNKPDSKRPLGYAVINWLAEQELACMCCGTNLALQDFVQMRSAAGVDGSYKMMDDFDFLELPQIKQLFNHFLSLPGLELEDVAELLRGRPRFTAQAIYECLVNGAAENAMEVIVNYTTRMMTEYNGEGAIGAVWKRLYTGKDVFHTSGGPVTAWGVARDMLLRSLLSSQGGVSFAGRTAFALNEARELVSHGISMIQLVDDDPKEVMAEPLILSAGITFFARQEDVDIAASLLERFNDQTVTDPHHRGNLLEILVAVRLFQRPDRLTAIDEWPKDVKQPTHPPRGILLGVPLTDPRLKFSSLDTIPEDNARYWIGLPETIAGPDLVYPSSLWSMKSSSTMERIASGEARKSIKTTNPSQLYAKAIGDDCEPTKVLIAKKREATSKAIEGWTKRIVRVRVELPNSAAETAPPGVLSLDGKWHCTSHDVDNSIRKDDVMLYISKANVNTILDIPWELN